MTEKNIVEKFKLYARELSKLYKKRKELNEAIADYEAELKSLGKILEFADKTEKIYGSSESHVN